MSEEIKQYIYIIQCCDNNGYIKIGMTSDDPLKRVASMQSGCPYELRLIATFTIANNDLKMVETILHTQLEPFRLRGEWFKLTATGAIQFVNASLYLLDSNYDQIPLETDINDNVFDDLVKSHQQQKTKDVLTPGRCKQQREALTLSQAQLATQADVSLSKLKRYESENQSCKWEEDELNRILCVLFAEK